MTEKGIVDQGVWHNGKIKNHEGMVPSGAQTMDPVGQNLLARSRFPDKKDGNGRPGDPRKCGVERGRPGPILLQGAAFQTLVVFGRRAEWVVRPGKDSFQRPDKRSLGGPENVVLDPRRPDMVF